MPALRNVRRSRRLSNKPPRDAVYEDPDEFHLHDDRQSPPACEATSSASDVRRASKGHSEPSLAGAIPPSDYDFGFVRRSSHSRKRNPNHIPRPPNAFLLFRSDLWQKEKIKHTVERDHRMISRIAGQAWNKLSESKRAPYRHMAELAKQQHAELYPDYKYTPVLKKERLPRRKGGRSEGLSRCTAVARLLGEGYEGDALEERLKSCDGKERELAHVPRPRKRTRARVAHARKARTAKRHASPDIRDPSPVALPENLMKMEPRTPELSFSPEPALESSQSPELLEPLLDMVEKRAIDTRLLCSPVQSSPFQKISTLKQWRDDPPTVVDFSYDSEGQGYLQASAPDVKVPVALCGFPQDDSFGEAVDDAFSISPMFNPDRSLSLLDPDASAFNTHSPSDGLKINDDVDFDSWLVPAVA